MGCGAGRTLSFPGVAPRAGRIRFAVASVNVWLLASTLLMGPVPTHCYAATYRNLPPVTSTPTPRALTKRGLIFGKQLCDNNDRCSTFLATIAISLLLAFAMRATYKHRVKVGKPTKISPFHWTLLFISMIVGMITALIVGVVCLAPGHDIKLAIYLIVWLMIFIAIVTMGRQRLR